MDRRLKNKSVHDLLGKRVVDQGWADYEEGGFIRVIGESQQPIQAVGFKNLS